MIRGGFLCAEDRDQLIALARDGSTVSRLTRRATRWCCWTTGGVARTSRCVVVERRTIRGWHKLFEQCGIEGLTSFDVGAGAVLVGAHNDGVDHHIFGIGIARQQLKNVFENPRFFAHRLKR
jgi:hypothetical protein